MSDSIFDGAESAAQATSTENAEFEDKNILCIDCSTEFVWSVGEQVFFRDKRLQNPPKRCKECKQAKNERLAAIAAAQASGVRQRIEVAVNCARCGESTTVPFYPSQGRPVYCRSCFLELNPNVLNGGPPPAG
jgi:CxxC-x17-CxxC domain-containing protein